MEPTIKEKIKLPIGLKIAAGYFILIGLLDLIWPLLNVGVNSPEFESLSTASKAGHYFRDITFALLFLTSGVGLFKRILWARKLGLWILVISYFYSINQFAYGLAQGKPNLTILAISTGIVGFWNAIWFYLIFKKSSKEVLVDTQKTLTQEQKTNDEIIASYSQRVTNLVIDTVFHFILFFILSAFISVKADPSYIEGFRGYLLGIFCILLYYFPQEALTGKTIGKLISGTEIIKEDGSKIGIKAAAGRTLCRLIPLDALSFIPDSNNRIGWHDRFPKTRVIVIR